MSYRIPSKDGCHRAYVIQHRDPSGKDMYRGKWVDSSVANIFFPDFTGGNHDFKLALANKLHEAIRVYENGDKHGPVALAGALWLVQRLRTLRPYGYKRPGHKMEYRIIERTVMQVTQEVLS